MGAFDFNYDLPAGETVAPSPDRVRALQALLPPQPFGIAPVVTDRAAWSPWQNHPFGQRVLKTARELAAQPFPDYTDATFLDCLEREEMTHINRVMLIVRERQGVFLIAEAIHDAGEFLDVICSDARKLAALRTWIHPYEDRQRRNFSRQTVESGIAVTHFGENLALTDYILGPRLPADFRALLRRELQARLFQPLRQRIETGRDLYWWLGVKHNWLAVCVTGIAQAAVAILPDAADRAWWLAFVETQISNFRDGFLEDGCCPEGVGYWSYGVMHYMMFAEVLRRGTGNVIDLLDDAKMRRIANFTDHAEIEPGVFPSYADSGPGGRPIPWVPLWLENRAGTPAPGLQPMPAGTDLLSGTGLHIAAESLLWIFGTRDPLRPVRRVVTPGLRHWFGASSLLICRPGPSTTRRFAATLLGGNNGMNHNHNDLGTFTVVLDGRTLIVDPGPEAYSFRTFSEKRYDSQLLNSYGHPVPRVAGALQSFGPDWRTRVLAKEFSDDTDRLVFDLRGAYDVPALRRLTREFFYDRRGAGCLTITDHVEFSEPAAFESALITFGLVAINGTNIRISDEQAALTAEVSCEGAALEISTDTINQPPHPTRIALRCSGAILQATVRTILRPA
jgi:hypothetical protein